LTDEIIAEQRNGVTDVPCAALVDGWDSVVTFNIYPFHPRRKSTTALI
jgi:hypothetical protein